MKTWIGYFLITVLIGLLFSCDKKGPEDLWVNRPGGDPSPVIKSISPTDRAGAGALDIVVQGENFNPVMTQNSVFFDNVRADILSGNRTELKVMRPNLTGDSISVQVAVQNAAEIGRYYPYAIDDVTGVFGLILPGTKLSAMAADAEGSVYVVFGMESVIRKFLPDGSATDYATYSGISSSSRICMRMGPDGFLYLLPEKKRNLYGVSRGGGEMIKMASPSFIDIVNCFDFDQNGNIYAGGARKSINLARPDDSAAQVADYSSFTVRALRVFQNYLYILAENTSQDSMAVTGVYRHEITSADGSLGPAERILAWGDAGEFAGSAFADLTFSADGDMLIATDNVNPILLVSSSGEQRPLYKEILTSTAEEFVWTGTRLYQRLGGSNNGLMWIAMGKAGAPYYGR